MMTFWFQLCVIVSAFVGAIFVTHLSETGFGVFAGGSLGVCAILGWVITFQNQGVKVQVRLWSLLGILQPIPSKWVQPLEISWTVRALVVVAAMIFGACARVLWLANA
jgi:hypothetical protein